MWIRWERKAVLLSEPTSEASDDAWLLRMGDLGDPRGPRGVAELFPTPTSSYLLRFGMTGPDTGTRAPSPTFETKVLGGQTGLF